MSKRIIVKSSKKNSITASEKRYVRAAGEDDFDMNEVDADEESLEDAIDDVADNVEDLQDSIDDMEEDDVEISVNNNIADHYIAECSRCKGIFISAVVESDQDIEFVSGVCPLCRRETEQSLKWIIKNANE